MSAEGFAERLRILVSGSASERAFAREVGIPQGTLRGLLAGKSPTLETLVAVASAKNVEYRWLATGEGPKDLVSIGLPATSAAPVPISSARPIDAELLGRMVDRIARIYREERVLLPDIDLGRIAAERYAQLADFSDDPDEWPHLLEVVSIRVRKAIRAAKTDPANVKHRASGS